MVEAWLIQRPDRGKGWTPWRDGDGEGPIERVWWQAKPLHFPKDNVSHWYDGSDLVGIHKWGFHGERWTMREPPADWQPMPAGYLEEAERRWRDWRTIRGFTYPADSLHRS